MHISFKSRIFNTVHCEMFNARHNILALNTSRQSCPHFSQMIGIFSVALLRTAPAWISWKIDAHTAVIVSAHCTNLCTDHFSNLLFQITVKAGTSCHRNRKAGGRSGNNTSWSVYETDIRNSQTFYCLCRIWLYIIVFDQEQIIQ